MDKIIDRPTNELSTEFLKIVWDSLESFFPQNELRSMDSQFKAFRHKNYFVSYFEEDAGIAFALWWDFDSMIFCEYIVVSRLYQRLGLGSQLIKNLMKFNKTIVLEVEKGESLAVFYTKNHFKINDIAYEALSLNGECAEQYELFSFPEQLTIDSYNYFWETINEDQYQF